MYSILKSQTNGVTKLLKLSLRMRANMFKHQLKAVELSYRKAKEDTVIVVNMQKYKCISESNTSMTEMQW